MIIYSRIGKIFIRWLEWKLLNKNFSFVVYRFNSSIFWNFFPFLFWLKFPLPFLLLLEIILGLFPPTIFLWQLTISFLSYSLKLSDLNFYFFLVRFIYTLVVTIQMDIWMSFLRSGYLTFWFIFSLCSILVTVEVVKAYLNMSNIFNVMHKDKIMWC